MRKITRSSTRRPAGRRVAADKRLEGRVRERVLDAAFAAFTEHGYDGASTLEIASRANVSKRELYALFTNKQGVLAACIAERAKQMRLPLELPAVRDRAALAATLTAFGTAVLRGVSHPKVLAVHRLAIAEAERAPGVAQALQNFARKPNHAALANLLAGAQSSRLIGPGEPAEMATQFLALLWRDLLIQLLLGVIRTLGPAEIEQRAHAATDLFLVLYPPPR